MGLPDVKGREEILRVHTRNKPLAPDVVLKTIAKSTVGFTGADLENLVNEAALLAAKRGRKAITERDIEEASIKVIAGPEKKSRVVTEKEKKLTAYHEAGHAITHYSVSYTHLDVYKRQPLYGVRQRGGNWRRTFCRVFCGQYTAETAGRRILGHETVGPDDRAGYI